MLYCSLAERYKCSNFEYMKKDIDQFEILRKIKQEPNFSQRELAK